ncbi:MAG: DNA polymerase III subunit gamma/tau [Lachnospiraceae bacterium]|nr:DNA polymerase III subunit gamma/tau [Lachnospiraceae bacterium]
MSYMALYRKWRPGIFEDVRGQEHIVTALKNQIKADRIGHAYLFCGTRGTGKTTVAKLFAKAVNCEHPVDGSPCGTCPTCQAIASQSSMNVIEIDAASNNGVDNIREIRDEVQYSPAEGKYKVYIIDEVHMLSIGAFNALLKTLEEPPSYVIFILATTEVHKIPVTILSRCQRYDFRRISIDTISERLSELMVKEEIEVEEKAIRYIAKAADGSMRDALSLLDQCIAFYLGKKLTYDNVLEVLGATDTEVFSRLIRMIYAQDTKGILDLVEEMMREGRELNQFATDFLWYIRNLLLLRTCDNAEETLDMSTENRKLLEEEAQLFDEEILMRYIRVISELLNQMRYSTQKRVLLEVGLIKLAKPQMETDTSSLLQRIVQLEQKLENGIVVKETVDSSGGGAIQNAGDDKSSQSESEGSDTPDAGRNGEAEIERRYEPATAEEVKKMASGWQRLAGGVGYPMKRYLDEAVVMAREDGKGLRLLFPLTPDGEIAKAYFDREKHKEALTEELSRLTGRVTEVETGQLTQEEQPKETILDLSKIKMPVTFE